MFKFVLMVTGVSLLIENVFSTDDCTESEGDISSDFGFDFASKYEEVLGKQMHYIDYGEGDPVLFIHGFPTSVYLWRNVMPYLENQARIIGIDLIGFGKSDKVSASDAIIDHPYLSEYQYVEEFISKLGLQRLTLVVHDWGSGIGLYYAYNHQDNVRGIAFMESMVPPSHPYQSWDALSADMSQFLSVIKYGGDQARAMIIDQNYMIESMLPSAIVRSLSESEMNYYREPFLNVSDREILFFPKDNPVEGEPVDAWDAVESYTEWFAQSSIPKLQIYGNPGGINSLEDVAYNQENMMNYESVYIGKAIHFIQEDHPQKIGRAIADWHRRNILDSSSSSSSSSSEDGQFVAVFTDNTPWTPREKVLGIVSVVNALVLLVFSIGMVCKAKQKFKGYESVRVYESTSQSDVEK